jgi:hypothetical protein
LIQENISDENKFKGSDIINSLLPNDLQLVKQTRKKREVVEQVEGEPSEIVKTRRFIKPTSQEVFDYMVENEFEFAKIESDKFVNFYDSKGWKVGKTPMVSWKSAVANWMKFYYERNKIQTPKISKLEKIQKSHETLENTDWEEHYKNLNNEQYN